MNCGTAEVFLDRVGESAEGVPGGDGHCWKKAIEKSLRGVLVVHRRNYAGVNNGGGGGI